MLEKVKEIVAEGLDVNAADLTEVQLLNLLEQIPLI